MGVYKIKYIFGFLNESSCNQMTFKGVFYKRDLKATSKICNCHKKILIILYGQLENFRTKVILLGRQAGWLARVSASEAYATRDTIRHLKMTAKTITVNQTILLSLHNGMKSFLKWHSFLYTCVFRTKKLL